MSLKVYANNEGIGRVSEHLERYSLGDGLGVPADETFENMSYKSGGLIHVNDVNLTPHAYSFKMQTKDKKEIVAIYLSDPASSPKTRLARAMIKEKDGSFEDLNNMEEIGIKGISDNPVRIKEITGLYKILIQTIGLKPEALGQLQTQSGGIPALSILLDQYKHEKADYATITISNIENVVASMQKIYDIFTDDLKEDIHKALKDNNLEKYGKMLREGKVKNLNKSNMIYIDMETLYKLAPSYFANKDGNVEPIEYHESMSGAQISRAEILRGDDLMAQELSKLNEDVIEYAAYSLTNYTVTGNTIGGGVLSVKTESISPSYDSNGFHLKEVIDKSNFVEINGKLLESNIEQLRKKIIPKKDREGNTDVTLNPTRIKQNLMAALSVSRYMETKIAPFKINTAVEQEISDEEYKKFIKEERTKLYSDQTKQAGLKNLVETTFDSFAKVFEGSDLLSQQVIKQLERLSNELKKEVGEKGVSIENFGSVYENVERAIRQVIVNLKLKQNNIMAMIADNNISPTDNLERFPRTNGKASTIQNGEFTTFRTNAKNINVIAGFGAKIVKGKDWTNENASFKFANYMTPILFLSDDKKHVLKTSVSINQPTKLAYSVQRVLKDCDKYATVEEDKVQELLEQTKNAFIKTLTGVEKDASANMNSKIFGIVSFYDFKKSIKDSNSFEELKKSILENPFFSSAASILDVSPLVETARAKKENILKTIESKPIEEMSVSENDKFPSVQVGASIYAGNIVKAYPAADSFKNGEEKDFSKVDAFRRHSEISGRSVQYNKNAGKMEFRRLSMGNKSDLKTDQESFLKILSTEEMDKKILEKIREAFPSKNGREQDKTVDNLRNLVNNITNGGVDVAAKNIEALAKKEEGSEIDIDDEEIAFANEEPIDDFNEDEPTEEQLNPFPSAGDSSKIVKKEDINIAIEEDLEDIPVVEDEQIAEATDEESEIIDQMIEEQSLFDSVDKQDDYDDLPSDDEVNDLLSGSLFDDIEEDFEVQPTRQKL